MAIKDWSTVYPSALDTNTVQPTVLNDDDVTRASQINTIRDVGQELQSQVGSDALESGSLRKRVTDNESDISTLQTDVGNIQTDLSTATKYVHRGSVAVDIFAGLLTIDDAWHTFSLSSIVPAGAASQVVHMFSNGATSTTDARNFKVRTVGASFAAGGILIPATGEGQGFMTVQLDASREFEYKMTTAGTLSFFNIFVVGYFLPI